MKAKRITEARKLKKNVEDSAEWEYRSDSKGFERRPIVDIILKEAETGKEAQNLPEIDHRRCESTETRESYGALLCTRIGNLTYELRELKQL
jgi:hypothetical protein